MSQGADGRYPKRGGLVRKKPTGEIYIDGVDLTALSPELYSCIWKLKDYEESGMSPSDVTILKNIYNDACETINKLRRERDEMKRKLVEQKLSSIILCIPHIILNTL